MNLAERLIEADRSSPKRVLVVGDGMTDVYIHGQTEDTCQEGCPKFVEESRVIVPGGAANAARSLERWYTVAVYFRNYVPTKSRFMVGGQCMFRHDNESISVDLSPIREESLLTLRDRSRPTHAVLLSDYDKGTLTVDFIREVVTACRELNIPCVADCKREPKVYQWCILKGNAAYAIKYQHYLENTDNTVVVTRGGVSPVIWQSSPYLRHELSDLLPVECINHVGAGDCFAAHLTLALAHGFSLKDAAAIAYSAGRVYVQHLHNRPPRPEEIVADMGGCC